MFMIFMPRDASLFLETPFMSGILTEAPRISGFLEISFRQWVHYPFRLPYQMEELFVVILTIFVNDVWNLPRISLMDSWTQHPILLNLFHHKLFLTLQNRNSLNQNKIFLQRSPLLRGMTVLNVVIPGGIVDLLIDMGIDSFKEGGVSENRTIAEQSCIVSVFRVCIYHYRCTWITCFCTSITCIFGTCMSLYIV